MNNIQSVSTPYHCIEVTQFITNLVDKHGFVGLLGIVLVYIIIGFA
jgi:hypothetical protein